LNKAAFAAVQDRLSKLNVSFVAVRGSSKGTFTLISLAINMI